MFFTRSICLILLLIVSYTITAQTTKRLVPMGKGSFRVQNLKERPYTLSLELDGERISTTATLRQPGLRGVGTAGLKHKRKNEDLRSAMLVYTYDTSAFKSEMLQIERQIKTNAILKGALPKRFVVSFDSNAELLKELALLDSMITISQRTDLAMVSMIARRIQEVAEERALNRGELKCVGWSLSQLTHVVRLGLPPAHLQRIAGMINDLFKSDNMIQRAVDPMITYRRENAWFFELGWVSTFSYNLKQKELIGDMQYVYGDDNMPIMARIVQRGYKWNNPAGYFSMGFNQTPLRWFYQGNDTIATARRGLSSRSLDASIGLYAENPQKSFRLFAFGEFGVQVHLLREYNFMLYERDLVLSGPSPSYDLHSWNILLRGGLGIGIGDVRVKGGFSFGLLPHEFQKNPAFNLVHLTTTHISLMVPFAKRKQWYYTSVWP